MIHYHQGSPNIEGMVLLQLESNNDKPNHYHGEPPTFQLAFRESKQPIKISTYSKKQKSTTDEQNAVPKIASIDISTHQSWMLCHHIVLCFLVTAGDYQMILLKYHEQAAQQFHVPPNPI